jgi:hypothetical protein
MHRKILYISGLLIPISYFLLYIIGGALRPGYSQISNSVSELLSPGSPNKTLLFLIQMYYAVLHILFGIGVLQFIQENGEKITLGSVGGWMVIAVGVATIGTAVFPQDPAGSPATLAGKIHIALVFGALIPFSFLSTLLIGIWTKKAGIFPGFNIYSYISVGLIILTGGFGAAMAESPIAGLAERIGAVAVHQWLFVLALKILSSV